MKKGLSVSKLFCALPYTFLICALCTQYSAFSQQYRWIDLTASLPDTSLFGGLGKVAFIGENGWITQGWYTLPREIYYTSDGGQTFSTQPLPADAGTIGDICIRENFEGYIVTYWDDAGNSGKIFHSDDARAGNWNLLSEISGSGFYSLAFPPLPSTTGYIGSAAGDVWKIDGTSVTYDGWCNTNYDVMGMSFPVNSDVGWAATSGIEHREATGWIMSGQNFQGDGLESVWFYDNNIGWICGSDRMIEHTTDGHNWIIQLSSNSAQLYGIAFSDLLNGWSVGVGSILHTSNGGADWIDESWQMDADDIELKSVSVVNSHTAYAAGERRSTLTPVFLKYTLTTGFEEPEKEQFVVSPNPTDGKFTIQQTSNYQSFKIVDIEMTDMSGNKVIPESIMNQMGAMRVDINCLKGGVYFLRMNSDHGCIVKKIIKF